MGLLRELQGALRECNSYVQDFVHAAEALANGGAEQMTLVINPEARPTEAHARTYNKPAGGEHTFNEVSVLMLDGGTRLPLPSPPHSHLPLMCGTAPTTALLAARLCQALRYLPAACSFVTTAARRTLTRSIGPSTLCTSCCCFRAVTMGGTLTLPSQCPASTAMDRSAVSRLAAEPLL